MAAAFNFLGTSIGGKKIIKSVGMDMVKLEKYQGFSPCKRVSKARALPHGAAFVSNQTKAD